MLWSKLVDCARVQSRGDVSLITSNVARLSDAFPAKRCVMATTNVETNLMKWAAVSPSVLLSGTVVKVTFDGRGGGQNLRTPLYTNGSNICTMSLS